MRRLALPGALALGALTMGALACGPGSGAGGSGGSLGIAGDSGGDGGSGGSTGGDGGGAGDISGVGGGGGIGGVSGTGLGGDTATGVAGATGGAGAGGGIAGDTGAGGGSGSGGGVAGSGGGGGDGTPATTLKSVAGPTDRLIGAALGAAHLAEPGYAAAARHFNFATPENEMKWDATEPARNVFSFDRGDAIVTFAAQSGMQVKGHTLVWHSQLPPWVAAIQDATELRNAMINHITQVALHFRGRVIAWDVVNEAVADGGGLRSSQFQQLLGARYLDDAFIAANAADPYARLYYNDYGTEGLGAKSNYVYNLVKDMLARGVPIHGVGLQMHTGATDSPSAAEVAANMQRLAALGLDLMITEMDVQICTGDLQAQSRRFHDIVAGCVAQPFCRAVTVWGVTDKYSWRNGQSCAAPRPLLFDDNYVPKPAYMGVINGFTGL